MTRLIRQGITNLHTAFPDLHYSIEELLTDNDKVVARCIGAGTHLGSFRNIPPTGKKMVYTVIMIWRFANNKLSEHWSVSDVYGMLQQLQVIKIVE
jgi:predicted ester cyclase